MARPEEAHGGASWAAAFRTLRERMRAGAQGGAPANEEVPAPVLQPREAADAAPDKFPDVPNAKLARLFPGDTTAACDERDAVRRALVEMELHYRLDPGAMNNKSELSRGYSAIADILRRVECAPRTDTGQHATSDLPGAQSTAHGGAAALQSSGCTRTYGSHDVFAAIDRKDTDRIMAIRDRDFTLLLGSQSEQGTLGGESAGGLTARTPLEYAISLGPAYSQISIFLVGAMSRFVNQLPDDLNAIENDPDMLATLRKVRANLKLAIDSSLAVDQTDLLASYVQVLVMAQGTAWIDKTLKSVAHELWQWAGPHELRQQTLPRPTHIATTAVMQFMTANFQTRKKRDQLVVAAVDDFVANATSDLVLMGLWSLLARLSKDSESVPESLRTPLPAYGFARDERITAMFEERVEALRQVAPSANQRLAKLWKAAQHICDALEQHVRRRSAAERFELLEKTFAA